jgi:hypothetical protein
MDANTFDTTSLVSQGAAITVVSTMSGQVTNLLLQMLPFCYVAIPLITLDLYYGRKKAQYRYEHKLSNIPCTIQKSVKMTLQKIFNYISWILLSTSISMAFGIPSLVFIIMAVIYGLEVLSLINKYGESKGIDIDEAAMLKLVFKFIWSRITGNFDETFNDVVRKHGDKKTKRPMNPQPQQ